MELVLAKQPTRVHHTRARAVEDYCSYSLGDMIGPAVCMPQLSKLLPPTLIYLVLLPGTIYVTLPMLSVLLIRGLIKLLGYQIRVQSLAIPIALLAVGAGVYYLRELEKHEHARDSGCLHQTDVAAGAHLVTYTAEDGTLHNIEYFRMGQPGGRKLLMQHGSLRGAVYFCTTASSSNLVGWM